MSIAAVLALVEERAGLTTPSCLAAAEEGIRRAMARAGLDDLDAYRARLARDDAALDDLLIELTIGETYFFRTPEHFEHLRRVVLPELRERHGAGYTARLWSAACSSGEEPYSLAALLMAEGWGEHMAVYGTDVSRGALERARRAEYGEWSLRGPWADRMRPHLRAEGRRYTLSPEVQRQVRFSYLNLALDTWPSPESGLWKLDVIFCRNVLIYFNAATIEGVARRLHDALIEGGYLFTGPSDPPLGALAPLQPVLTEWGVLYRRPLAGTFVAPAPPVPPAPVGATSPGASAVFEARAPLAEPARPRPPAVFEARAPLAPAPAVEPAKPPAPDTASLEAARRALALGDWPEAARRVGALDGDADTAAAAVRALANLDAQAAVYASTEAASRHPLSAGLRYLEALLLLGQGRFADAERAARRALYLEPGLVVAWLVLGRALGGQGEPAEALRAWREAEALCAGLPPDTAVPLAEGERAGGLAAVARGERLRLEAVLSGGEGTS
ncbi:MAG TPA: protein-glutamate O-methyltransferase CheR [Myxococcus sp.]|nr:protein-glutamate O-methyltransferase CheR [Myxococcus sp.]